MYHIIIVDMVEINSGTLGNFQGMGTMLAKFHMCGIMLVLRAVLNILVRNASIRWHYMF